MEKRHFKNTGEQVSLLGFGCMRLPKLEGREEIDTGLAQRMVDYAYANGVNYYDTAYPYHEGLSETFIGEVLKKYPRDSFNLADKLPTWLIEREADVPRYLEEQLVKCQVDHFDYYLVHALSASRFEILKKHRIFEQLQQKREEGVIRHLGFSFHDQAEVIGDILAPYDWDFAQIQLNYLDWEGEQNARRQYELIEQKGIQCVVMEPVRGGTLARLSEEALAVFQQADPKASAASWAIRYVASKPNVLTVLSGMSNLDHVVDNVATMSPFKPLSPEEERVVARALEAFLQSAVVPCTGCRYCMDCPSGVDIPKAFEAYNLYATTRSKRRFMEAYTALAESARADRCTACRACVDNCPQQIDIPARMAKVAELAER
ncbi:MAG: aldo/keto reductase [Clostridiales bacterium]|nr:aldo/keto reductase [Clostridiales bacterium]